MLAQEWVWEAWGATTHEYVGDGVASPSHLFLLWRPHASSLGLVEAQPTEP